MNNLDFNSKPSTVLHIDLNSCFATIEQQANPLLRGRPIAVAAYATSNGCILAPSIEAKRFGVQTGMRVKDGKELCPELIILSSDPWKYRNVHLKLRKLLSGYTNDLDPKSIDEFVLNLDGTPSLVASSMEQVGREIKKRIKAEIGDWLTVSVGISTNRFLAKLASSIHKPDGLDEINKENFLDCYLKLELTDLPYIKIRNAARLSSVGIQTVVDFYDAPLWKLKAAFLSVNSYYWHTRLRGYEIDNTPFGRRSYGNSYALPKSFATPGELSPILSKLVTKTSARLRKAGYKARGVHLAIYFRDGGFWHRGLTFDKDLFDTRDIYKKAYRLMLQGYQGKPVRNLFVSVFNLTRDPSSQLELFENIPRKENLNKAVDTVNTRWGDYVISPARTIPAKNNIPDRIAFGGVKELEEFLNS